MNMPDTRQVGEAIGGLSPRVRRALVAGGFALAVLLTAGRAAGQATRPATAAGSADLIATGVGADGKIRLLLNKSGVVTTRVPYKRVNVAQPEVADLNLIGTDSLLVTAKKPGETQLIVWDDANQSQVVDVVVQVDLAGLREQLKAVFPAAKIEVVSANGTLALRGQVSTLSAAEQAVKLSEPYGGGKVLNFLEVSGGQQVMLQVRFAEVSRSASTALGVSFGYTDGRAILGSNIGQVSPLTLNDSGGRPVLGVPPPSSAVTLFGRGEVGQSAFDFFISALRQNNLMRVLAEPNLVTVSGQEANFLAGGEFPIPVPQDGAEGGSSTITIEYREFGVKLKFVPVVLGDGRIRLTVAPEVSDLDFTTAVRFGGFVVPGLTSRKLNTTVELGEGQTFAIGGLLNTSVQANKDVMPLLGDVPVIGALFRSVRYQRKETELVVLVTPRLVEALNPGQVPGVPGGKWRHPTMNDLFWEQDLGGPQADARQAPATRPDADEGPRRFRGSYGFTPVRDTAAAGD